jgi:hypothetical protein
MEAHTHKKMHRLKRERGQGLVEMALILPFLLILVIGIVEVGLALNRQLTVVNAAREGARFGAFGATADDVHTETLDATSQMFDFTDENAVVVVIHAETNEDGDGFDEWTETIYPSDATVPHVTQQEVLDQLQAEGDAADLKLVVVDVRYDHQSMLGLPFVGALADQIPIGSWTVMRIPALHARNPGCCALPIALHVKNVNWPDGFKKNTKIEDIHIGSEPGQFGWLFWDPDNQGSATNLIANLSNRCNAWAQFEDACDSTETTLTGNRWVTGDTGWSVASGVGDALVELRKGDYAIPIWDRFEECNDIKGPGCPDCQPGHGLYHIVGFALVRITDFKLTGDMHERYISAKFKEFYVGCPEPEPE